MAFPKVNLSALLGDMDHSTFTFIKINVSQVYILCNKATIQWVKRTLDPV